MYVVIEGVLKQSDFSGIDCAVHVSLSNLIKDYSTFSAEEAEYAHNPLTHMDFLLFDKMDKTPVLAIEVDGVSFHQEGSKQFSRDRKKDHIFELIGVPLLRLRTDGSQEKERLESALVDALNR